MAKNLFLAGLVISAVFVLVAAPGCSEEKAPEKAAPEKAAPAEAAPAEAAPEKAAPAEAVEGK